MLPHCFAQSNQKVVVHHSQKVGELERVIVREMSLWGCWEWELARMPWVAQHGECCVGHQENLQ